MSQAGFSKEEKLLPYIKRTGLIKTQVFTLPPRVLTDSVPSL
jgi:hypothetical protein